MNKYLAFFSFVALCVCLSEAVTRNEAQRAIHLANKEARNQALFGIKTAVRDVLIQATTPQQRACAHSKLGPANREISLTLNNKLVALENEINSKTPEELAATDLESWTQKCNQEFAAGTAVSRSWVQQIKQCA